MLNKFLEKFKWLVFWPSKPVKKNPKKGSFSNVYPLAVPLAPDEEKGWKPYPIFKRFLKDKYFLTAHASVLVPGYCPHPPHKHEEEEILIMLAGEADLLMPELEPGKPEGRIRAKTGDFVYYPAGFPHSIEAAGTTPANYLMFKWSSKNIKRVSKLNFRLIENLLTTHQVTAPEKFSLTKIFEGRTAYLNKLECHFSQMPPGQGYDEHIDHYDVAILVLEGEVETLQKRVGPHGVIFYAAGEPHGMHNPGQITARYLVFEFHFNGKPVKK